jgi:hypothetical protein
MTLARRLRHYIQYSCSSRFFRWNTATLELELELEVYQVARCYLTTKRISRETVSGPKGPKFENSCRVHTALSVDISNSIEAK